MKKTLLKVTMIVMIMTMLASFTVVSAAASDGPADFKMIDNFDGYADTKAALDAGYGTYPYGNLSTTIEISSADVKSGKGLKVSNGGAAERLDFLKTVKLSAGADGFSFWFNNTSGGTVNIGPLVNYNALLTDKKYYTRAEGTAAFVETQPAGNQWFPIEVADGFKGEIVIPFSSLQTLYPEAEDTVIVIQVWGVATPYSVVLDDFRFYGVDDPDPVKLEATKSETTKSETTESDISNPKTGEGNQEVIFLVLLVMSGFVLVTSIKRMSSVK